ncbi:MAG: single-stranded DNA-binding protein [Acidobacteriota bacterium]|nr:single-stranded DNA-binding protein [Acidobacteriota bacterium]
MLGKVGISLRRDFQGASGAVFSTGSCSLDGGQQMRTPAHRYTAGQTNMLNLNRITLIGNTGADAKTTPNGPTTLSLASNVSWTDNTTGERRTRTEWHSLVVIWN